MERKFGFIGGGNMCRAIIGGMLKNSVVLPYTTTRMPGISPGNLCVTNLNQGLDTLRVSLTRCFND